MIYRVSKQSLNACLIAFGVVVISSITLWPVQPGDDFSAAVHRPAREGSASWMSLDTIESILSHRMGAVNSTQATALAQHLLRLCDSHSLDPAFVLSMIQVESAFKARAISPAGAVGLMQLMPATAQVIVRDFAPGFDAETLSRLKHKTLNQSLLMDPFVNLSLGVAYLAYLRDRYHEVHPYYLVAAYNIGPARMDELMSKKDFKPGKTRKYFEAIRQAMFQFQSRTAI